MRHAKRRRTAALIAAILASGSDPAAAQGFGFLFGEPAPYRRMPRRVRSVPPAPADVPLPPPRPHFAEDDPPAAVAAKPATATPKAEAAKNEPTKSETVRTEQPKSEASKSEPSKSDAPKGEPTKSEPTKSEAAATKSEPAKPDASRDATRSDGASDATAKAGPLPTAPPLPPEKPADIGAAPANPATPNPPAPPTVAPSGASLAFDPRQPALDAGCVDRLKARGVEAEPAEPGPQPDPRCTIVQPMRLTAARLADGMVVSFPDKPLVACITADTFAAYVRSLLAPLAKGTWGVGLASVSTGPGFECRARDHVVGAKLSAHGQGLAVDIAQMKLTDGRVVGIGRPTDDKEQDFATAARAGGCGYFHTALGPGTDAFHATHWHFDLEVRGKDGDTKYCR